MSTDSSAFSERSFEEEIHGQVFERDITRDRESCFRGGHAPRADTRGGTGLPQLGGHYGTAEPVRTSDFSIEFSCLERIANCIAPRLHFSTQLGTGRCRLTLLRSTIFLGSPFTERLTALLQNNIENTLVQENAGIEQQELNEKNSCKETQGGRADEVGTGCCHLTLLGPTIFLGSTFAEHLTALQNNIEKTLVQAAVTGCCHKDTLVLEGGPYDKKHCKLPARRGGNASQHEIAEMHCDGRSRAEEHCELHNTANHTLCTQVGAQEAIIMESVMLIMERHQSTSTRPAALRHTEEHLSHTSRRRREPAKQKYRERNLEEEKNAEPGKKDK